MEADYVLPGDTDPSAPIFRADDGSTWSLNSVWHDVQGSLDPYGEIEKGAPPTFRTARIAYPGTASLDTPGGPMRIGHVFLSVAMWIEPETVTMEEARRISYGSSENMSIQRVEFASARERDWRISLQTPAEGTDVGQVRVGGSWPHYDDL